MYYLAGFAMFFGMVGGYILGWYILGQAYDEREWNQKRQKYYKKYHRWPWW